jgi:alpha-glucosidase
MNIHKVLLAVRVIGLKKSISILRYTLERDWLDRAYRRKFTYSERKTTGRLLEMQPVSGGAHFQFEDAALEVIFLEQDMVRISWEPGLPPIPYALVGSERPETAVQLLEEGPGWVVASSSLHLIVQPDGEVCFRLSDGSVLRTDLPPDYRRAAGNHSVQWTHRTLLRQEERIYGLGERATSLNRRGGRYILWNNDPGGGYSPGADPLYINIPVYLSLHGLGSSLVFYENPFSAEFSVGRADPGEVEDWITARFEDGMLRYYFIAGPPDRAIERYTRLTGRAPLPPRWSLGYHQSRWGYKSENDIRQVAEGFKANDLPLSAIHLDLDYMDAVRAFTVDKKKFPDLPGLTAELEQQGIKTVAILDPGIKQDPGWILYTEGVCNGFICTHPDGTPATGRTWLGAIVFPDFTLPEGRAWWGDNYRFFIDQGLAGIWHDMNEPTSFTAWGDMTLPLHTRHALEGRGGDHRQAHNLYGLLMNQTGFKALRRLRPEKRPWIVSRAGWAGMQRSSWCWTGDTETSWKALRISISTVLGLGMSGVPFSGPDVGGFSGNPSPELYVRWFQLATFLPFFRTHSSAGTRSREPWVFGEPYTSILRELLKVRSRLMPYLYSLAWQSSRDGAPLVRPLFWLNPNAQDLWDVDDSFLLGDSLLVAPILEEGAKGRTVRLLPGEWYSYWDDQIISGQPVWVDASLERIPLFVKAGSLIPMEEGNDLYLHIYPDQKGTATGWLYSDSGDGYGNWRVDRFTVESIEGEILVRRTEEGEYPFPYSRVIVQVHGQPAEQVESVPFVELRF